MRIELKNQKATTDFTDLHCLFEIKLEVAFEELVEGFFIL
jgi:hypothetical protein